MQNKHLSSAVFHEALLRDKICFDCSAKQYKLDTWLRLISLDLQFEAHRASL